MLAEESVAPTGLGPNCVLFPGLRPGLFSMSPYGGKCRFLAGWCEAFRSNIKERSVPANAAVFGGWVVPDIVGSGGGLGLPFGELAPAARALAS